MYLYIIIKMLILKALKFFYLSPIPRKSLSVLVYTHVQMIKLYKNVGFIIRGNRANIII
jgi:hypothetical protein